MRRALLVIACVLFGACHEVDEREPNYPRAATVCVVRESRLAGQTVIPVRDNGKLMGETRGANFLCWGVAPGEHQIEAGDESGPVLVQAEPHGSYYLRQEMLELVGTRAHLDWITENAAHRLMAECDGHVVGNVTVR